MLYFANNSSVGGTNTIKYVKGDGSASVRLNGGTGAIAFDSSVSAQDVYLQKLLAQPTSSILRAASLTKICGSFSPATI